MQSKTFAIITEKIFNKNNISTESWARETGKKCGQGEGGGGGVARPIVCVFVLLSVVVYSLSGRILVADEQWAYRHMA